MGSHREELLRRRGEGWPVAAALAAVCLASAVTIVVLGSRLTFYNDDWYVLMQRPGLSAHTVLSPHNGHLSAIPILIYKGLVELAGLDSQLPFRLVAAAIVVSLALTVFVFVRERLGAPLAVVAAALLLFLGPAWQDLLWTFEIGLEGSMAAGIAAIIALGRGEDRADRWACGLLVLSILFSNLGVCFILAAGVEVLLRRLPSQAWIPGIPALLFAVWWVAYGHDSPSYFSLDHAAHVPAYVLDSMSSGLAALSGLSQSPDGTDDPLAWGRPLLALIVAGGVVWVLRGGRPPARLAVIATAAVSFWVLAGVSFAEWRNPFESRYLIISGAFLILIAAELFRSVALRPAAVAAIAVAGLMAIGANLSPLRQGYDFFRDQTRLTKADLGVLDLARAHVAADFTVPSVPTFPGGRVYLLGMNASQYFRERDAHGSPAYSPQQIAAASPTARESADAVLGLAYGLRLAPASRPPGDLGGCRRLAPAFDASARELPLPAGGARLTNLGQAGLQITLRRFAVGTPQIELGALAGRASAQLAIPPDSAPNPWYLGASGGAPLRICRLAF